MKVLLRTRSQGKYDWKNEVREFERIPGVGEYVALGADGPWYSVQLVVNIAYATDVAAEIYTVQVDPSDVKHRALHGKA